MCVCGVCPCVWCLCVCVCLWVSVDVSVGVGRCGCVHSNPMTDFSVNFYNFQTYFLCLVSNTQSTGLLCTLNVRMLSTSLRVYQCVCVQVCVCASVCVCVCVCVCVQVCV